MLTFSLLILCLNLDALSYGIANGAKNRKFSILYVLVVCLMSTIMFAVPLAVSKYVFQYFDETACRLVNATILIAMGIFYMIPKKISNKSSDIKNDPNYSQNNLTQSLNNTKSNIPNTKISFSRCFIECLVISVDAIFTAFLSGFSENYFIFSVALYAVTNFLAILFGNRLLYKISNKINFRLDLFSGLIFILLGVLKIIGF